MLPTTTDATVAAVLGTVEEPKVKFTDTLKVYTEEIAKNELASKSSEQFRKWKVIPERAIRNFTAIVRDVALSVDFEPRQLKTLSSEAHPLVGVALAVISRPSPMASRAIGSGRDSECDRGLKWQQGDLQRIALNFSPEIV